VADGIPIAERDLNLFCASENLVMIAGSCRIWHRARRRALLAAYEPVMADNHRGVIGISLMALTNAEKQARWRERHLKNENGTKLRAQFIFDASTRAQLKRIACHKGCSVTSLIKEWAASAERRITHQLSGKALKQYYDGE
jgi:hypothetical protein